MRDPSVRKELHTVHCCFNLSLTIVNEYSLGFGLLVGQNKRYDLAVKFLMSNFQNFLTFYRPNNWQLSLPLNIQMLTSGAMDYLVWSLSRDLKCKQIKTWSNDNTLQ